MRQMVQPQPDSTVIVTLPPKAGGRAAAIGLRSVNVQSCCGAAHCGSGVLQP
jgi:hypothetical protein